MDLIDNIVSVSSQPASGFILAWGGALTVGAVVGGSVLAFKHCQKALNEHFKKAKRPQSVARADPKINQTPAP